MASLTRSVYVKEGKYSSEGRHKLRVIELKRFREIIAIENIQRKKINLARNGVLLVKRGNTFNRFGSGTVLLNLTMRVATMVARNFQWNTKQPCANTGSISDTRDAIVGVRLQCVTNVVSTPRGKLCSNGPANKRHFTNKLSYCQ